MLVWASISQISQTGNAQNHADSGYWDTEYVSVWLVSECFLYNYRTAVQSYFSCVMSWQLRIGYPF